LEPGAVIRPGNRVFPDRYTAKESTASFEGVSMQEQTAYNYKVVRQFAIMTEVWGIVDMAVGVPRGKRC
jgi:hypothetical protein